MICNIIVFYYGFTLQFFSFSFLPDIMLSTAHIFIREEFIFV